MSRSINFQTVSWFWDLYTRKLLDMDPPYQRRSVWNQDYKDFFIDTVLNGYPAPAIFLYQEITDEGQSKYSVVDGKQRLSTLFEFAENKFPVGEKATISKLRGKFFKELETEVKQNFWKYQFAVEYVPSEDKRIINDIFDRINRNVIKLTPQELRHARFSGVFMTAVEELTDWMFAVLPSNFPAISTQLKKQMKDAELVAHLLLFLEKGVKPHNQDDLDQAFSDRDLAWDDEQDIKEEFKTVIQLIKNLLDQCSQSHHSINLSKTRLKNQADFYSLFGAITELHREQSLEISPDICQGLSAFLDALNSPETNSQEIEEYNNATSPSSLVYSTKEKNRTKIDILKSVILGKIKILAEV